MKSPVITNKIAGLVEHLFRREWGNLIARLATVFGFQHLDHIEDVVQDALIQAMRHWPHTGAPKQPSAWLYRVACNRMLDLVRRETCFARRRDQYIQLVDQQAAPVDRPHFQDELVDQQLALVFACCVPQLPRRASVALTLKVACGFSVDEIAAAFLSPRATISQRLVRAKKKLRAACEIPGPESLQARLAPVLEVIYVLFNEGYSASHGDELIRKDLCQEALRLVEILLQRESMSRPETLALAALICLQSARLGSRVDERGISLLLQNQDQSNWDRSLICKGFNYLERAASGPEDLSAYHLQAAIAACHAQAGAFENLDWVQILQFYDRLLELQASPMIELNRAVALAYVEGPAAGLLAVDRIADSSVQRHFLFLVTRAELLERSGLTAAARVQWQQAADCDLRLPQRRHIQSRIASLSGMINDCSG